MPKPESMDLAIEPDEIGMLAASYGQAVGDAVEEILSGADVNNWEMWDSAMDSLLETTRRLLELLRAHRSLVEDVE